jgi:hypothetical protein
MRARVAQESRAPEEYAATHTEHQQQEEQLEEQQRQDRDLDLLPDADLVRTQMALHVNDLPPPPAAAAAGGGSRRGGAVPGPPQQQQRLEAGAGSEEYVYDFYIADATGWRGEGLAGDSAGGDGGGSMMWEGAPTLQVR